MFRPRHAALTFQNLGANGVDPDEVVRWLIKSRKSRFANSTIFVSIQENDTKSFRGFSTG